VPARQGLSSVALIVKYSILDPSTAQLRSYIDNVARTTSLYDIQVAQGTSFWPLSTLLAWIDLHAEIRDDWLAARGAHFHGHSGRASLVAIPTSNLKKQ
jgi:hypothetical protein